MKYSVIFLSIILLLGDNLNAQDQLTNKGNLQIHPGTTVSFLGDFVNDGTFTAVSSTVTFNGSSAQSIGGTTTSTFSNIEIDNSIGVVLDRDVNIDNDLTITSGYFDINTSNYQINLGGNFINNGNFIAQSGKIVFNGTTTQQVLGSATTTFNNIYLTNTATTGLQIESNANLEGKLTLSDNTTFDADGSGTGIFTLVSNASEDSKIETLPAGASIMGNLVFEKYFAGTGFKFWHHISSAVLDATIADLQVEIPISGSFTGTDNGTNGIPSGAYPSLYYYNNGAGLPSATLDDRWVKYPASSNTELLTSSSTEARGYTIWMRDTGSVTYDLTGTVNQGNIDFAPTGDNEGWNLLGNPYPSDIDWDAVTGWIKTDIQGNAIHVWTGTQYLTWNGTTGSLGNGLIAKGQAFWIEAAESTIGLTATEAVKTNSVATTYRTFQEENPPIIELSVSASGYNDRTYIQFNDSSVFEFDRSDASKMKSPIFNLSTMSSDSVELSINLISGNQCTFDVPVILSNTWNDNYSFSWKISPELFDLYTIELEDHFTGDFYNINNEDGFNFEISDDTASTNDDRFMLHFETTPIDVIALESSQKCDDKINATITLSESQFGVEYSLWIDNQAVETMTGYGEMLLFELDSTQLTPGMNSFIIKASRSNCATQLDFNVEFEYIEAPGIITVIDGLGCYNSAVTLLVSNSLNAISYRWYDQEFDIYPIAETDSTTFVTPNLTGSHSYFVSAVNTLGCESSRTEIIATIVPSIALANSIVSNDSICHSDDLLVSIESSIPNIKYFIGDSEKVISDTIEGNGGDIEILVYGTNLIEGQNSLFIHVLNETCNETLPLKQSFTTSKSSVVSSVQNVSAENICNAGTVTIFAKGANENELYSWFANENDTLPILIEKNGIFDTPFLSKSHFYYVSIINETGCESERIPIEAKVNQLTLPLVTVDTLDFDNYLLRSSYPKNNQWYFNNSPLIGETNQTINPSESGFYKVQVISEGCTVLSDSVEVNNLILGTEEITEHFNIKMYPNPATDMVMIDLPMPPNQDMRIMIYSMDGKVQHHVDIKDHENNTIFIDLRSYVPGIYILKMIVNSNPYSYKLIIQ